MSTGDHLQLLYYFNLFDDRNCVVSTEHEEL